MREFRINGKSFPVIITESGKCRINGVSQQEFFSSLPPEDKKHLAVAEARFKHPKNVKSRQQILDDLAGQQLIRTD